MRRLAPTLLLLAAQALAQEPSLASFVPPDTPVYFEVRCPTPEEHQRLAVAKVFEDPRMTALLRRARSEDNSLSSMRFPLGDAVLSVRSDILATDDVLVEVHYQDAKGERSFRLRNWVALAVVDLTKGPFPVDGVVAFETEGDAKEAAAVLERIAAAGSLAARGEKGDIDEESARLVHHADHRGITYAWAEVGGIRICLAPIGRMIVVATGEARMRDVIDRSADPASESLAKDARHLAMLASVPGGGTATTQIEIHVDRGLRKLEAAYPPLGMIARQALTQVGLRDLESMTTVARVEGEGVRATTAILLAPAAHRGGLGRLFDKGGAPPSYGGLAYAPADAIYVNCGNVDVPGFYDMIRDLGGIQFAMAVPMPIERDLGKKLKEDFVDLLGPEITFIVSPNRGLLPDAAVICGSSDAARLDRNLVELLSRVKWPVGAGVSEFKLRDVTVHAVPLGHPGLGNIPLAPTFGVVDGRFVVAPYPLSFQRMLAVKRGDRPSIEADREFARLRAKVPPEAQGLSYLDFARIFELFYDTCLPFAQAMTGGAGPQQLYELPDVETLSHHLFGRIAWRTSDERGLHWSSYASMDTSSFTLSLVAGASAGLYYFRSAKEEAVAGEPPPPAPGEAKDDGRLCLHHVRMLRARLQNYRKDNGRLPGKLEEIEAKWMEPDTFVVPGTDGKRYVYLGPAGQGDVLLHGYPNGPDGLVTVLSMGLKAERVSAQELEQRKAAREGR